MSLLPTHPGTFSRRTRTLCALVAFAAVAAACSLPVSDQVENLVAEDYPEIFAATTTTTSAVPDEDDQVRTIELYFVADGSLEKVERPFSQRPNVGDVLEAIAKPPLDDEAALFDNRLGTELSDGLNPSPLEIDRETLVYPILLNPEVGFRQLAIDDAELARLIAGQIACTMVGLPLELDGASDAGAVEVTGIELFDSAADDAEPITVTDLSVTPIDGPIMPVHFDGCKTGTEMREEQLNSSSATSEPTDG